MNDCSHFFFNLLNIAAVAAYIIHAANKDMEGVKESDDA